MAALHNLSNTSLLNKNTNDEDVIESRLPNGGCNYTNLSLGVNAAKCGCKRFWDKSLVGLSIEGASGKTGFCMCEHHACFHDHTASEQDLVVGGSNTPRQRLGVVDRSIQGPNVNANREPGSSLQDTAVPDSMQWSRYIHGSSQGLPAIPSQCLLPSDNGSMTSGSQSGYSRPFGGRGLDTLSHIPRPGDPLPQASTTRMQIYEDRYGVQHLQSLTEVATPSLASQDEEVDPAKDAASVANRLETILESQRSQTAVVLRIAPRDSTPLAPEKQLDSTTVDKSMSSGRRIKLVLHEQQLREPNDLPKRIANHEERIDQLENVSFTHPAIDGLEESYDMMDTRVVELENRVDEIQKAQEGLLNNAGSYTRQSIEGSFASDTSSAMIVAAMDNIDSSRVEVLEAQVAELQAVAPPSYSRPWEVEVVFLPFGSQLHGIWSTQENFTPNSRVGSTGIDDWTQTQHNSMALAQACLSAHDQSTNWERSASDLAEGDTTWLMAKACGLNTRVDNRLRSRGLVKTIQICGPDARDVQSAMLKGFENLPQILAEDPFASQDENLGEVPRNLRSYIGLQATWIPLRKVHKDTCLRFLNPAEMITPALWTVPFLSSSVAMRHAGLRRLYVTQRDSYIQHHSDSVVNWTWQKLRQLDRVYPETSSLSHTPEADAQEECWAYDARLDPPPSVHASVHSSFHSQISQLSIGSLPGSPNEQDNIEIEREPVSPSDHFSSAAASPTTSTPRTSIPPTTIPLSPRHQRNPFHPIRRRTISMSSLIPIKGEPSSQNPTTKRRIPSFELEREVQSSPIISSQVLVTKRRRISRSPSRPRNTPRWSVGGSQSPFPFHDNEGRGTTPFAYATPHSNAPYVARSGVDVDVYEDDEVQDLDFDDEDEERESTTDADEDEVEEDEEGCEQNALSDFGDWQGVQDDHAAGQNRQVEIDEKSEMSNSPSEYPSTKPRAQQHLESKEGLYEWRTKQKTGLGFRIHVDDEGA